MCVEYKESNNNEAQQKKWSGHGRTGRTADYGLELPYTMFMFYSLRYIYLFDFYYSRNREINVTAIILTI